MKCFEAESRKNKSLCGIQFCLKFEIKFSSKKPRYDENSFRYVNLDLEEPASGRIQLVDIRQLNNPMA